MIRLSTVWLAATAVSISSCTAGWYAVQADEEVAAVIGDTRRALDEDRRSSVIQPGESKRELVDPVDRQALEGDPSVLAEMQRDDSGSVVVDLANALLLAVTYNRDYRTRFETLYRQGLGYTLTRFDFGPQLNWTIDSIWSDSEDGLQSESQTSRLSMSQLLPTGANFSLGSSFTADRDETPGSAVYGSAVDFSLTQPLLRGRGYEVSYNAWTQAQRDIIYSARDFELFRQQFCIDTARNYFDLLSQRQTLANEEANYSEAVFDRKKAEGLYATDRQPEQEVIRARRRELLAENALVDARVDLEVALEQFKITLGLPTSTPVVLSEEEPEFESVTITSEEAFEVARVNRLDLMTERQQIEDAERLVRIADNSLLPNLDLTLAYSLADSASALSQSSPDDWSTSAGVSLEIPLQRLPERNSYRTALLNLGQSLRNYRNRLDQLEIDVGNRVRRLVSIERQIELQVQLIEQERRAVVINEIKFEAGDAENRDLLESRQSLINARNALIRFKVDHFIGRLSLMRDLGILFIDEKGMWQ